MPKLPPEVNGIMDLAEEDILDIKAKLLVIQSAFVATDEQPVCDTFYLTATFNQANEHKINGDTAQYCLAYGEGGVA